MGHPPFGKVGGVPASVFVGGPLRFNDECLYCLCLSMRESMNISTGSLQRAASVNEW